MRDHRRVPGRPRLIRASGYLGLPLAALVAATSACLAQSTDNALAEAVREANGRFKDVAGAVTEGYAPIPCASGIEGGAMGSTTSIRP